MSLRALAVPAAALSGFMLTAGAIWATGPSPAPRASPVGAVSPTFGFGRAIGPFSFGGRAFGRRVSLAQAEELMGTRFFRPDHPLANDSKILSVFVEVGSGSGRWIQAAIDYESGILVTVERARGRGLGDYAGFVADVPGAYVTTVQGVPAAVIPANTNGAPNAAVVDVTLKGFRVALFSMYARLPPETLMEVAETLG